MKQDPKSLPADEVIEKFGGLRPLANRLGVAASTVQGWKQRGLIPENRVALVLNAALEDGIELDSAPVTQKDKPAEESVDEKADDKAAESGAGSKKIESRFTGKTPKTAAEIERDRRDYRDRRRGADRRKSRDPNFKGPDRRVSGRRSGIDRRQKRAEEWVHKKKFLERWILTMAFMFIFVVLASIFLLAPEYQKMQERQQEYAEIEQELETVKSRLQNLRESQGSISGKINEGLNKVNQVKDDFMSRVESTGESAEKAAGEAAGVLSNGNWQQRANFLQDKFSGLAAMMERVESLNQTPGGTEALMESLNKIGQTVENEEEPSAEALEKVRQEDPVFRTLTRDVESSDLKAAAMLLTLNKLRGTVGKDAAPFSEDLALLQKLGGDDPETQAAIERLTPYARSGVLSQERLQGEFKGLAGEIVMAKLRGEDASVQERALARLDDLMTIRKTDPEGQSTDAVVARAQKMLDEGNVEGALEELQTLEGEPAKVAEPWMQHARTRVAADQASTDLSEQMMGELTEGQNFSPAALKKLVRSLLNDSGQASVVSGQQDRRSNSGGTYPGLTGQ
ncbi:MAG: mitofilin family membrane protein [Pseudomonadota bacterium]